MKVKILKQTFVRGDFAEAGKVVEASEKDGRDLIGSGHAIIVAEDIKKPEKRILKVTNYHDIFFLFHSFLILISQLHQEKNQQDFHFHVDLFQDHIIPNYLVLNYELTSI